MKKLLLTVFMLSALSWAQTAVRLTDGTVFYNATTPADTQPVSGTFWQATQPVSIASTVTVSVSGSVAVTGTFWQATQPVSGTFWQATQPVSGPLTDTQLRATAVPVSGTVALNVDRFKILDSGGTNLLSVSAGGAAKVDGSAVTQPVSGTFWQATQPVSGTVAATQSGTWTMQPGNTANTTAWKVTTGDPCQSNTKSFVTISQTANTKTINNAANATTVYICSVQLVTATAQNVAVVAGTQSTTPCDTSASGILGGATAATGWNFAANGGIVVGNGNSSVAKQIGGNLDVCVFQSSSGQVSGNISYVTQ